MKRGVTISIGVTRDETPLSRCYINPEKGKGLPFYSSCMQLLHDSIEISLL
jgi:hypothetical protein